MKFYRRARYSYWSNYKLIAWLDREHMSETPKKKYYTFEEMTARVFRKRKFFESLASNLQNTVMFPLDFIHSIKIYFKNCKGNTHVLDGGLEKGVWYDLDYRISQCLFTELEKYIEQDKGLEMHAWEQSLVWDGSSWVDKEDERFGLPTPQALSAQEQEVIYQWWKENKSRVYTNMEDEAEYRKEEEEMLIRLIKIRQSLWT